VGHEIALLIEKVLVVVERLIVLEHIDGLTYTGLST